MAEVSIGIDVGTTRVKASLVMLDGTELVTRAESTPWQHTSGGLQVDVDELADLAIEVAARSADHAGAQGHRLVSVGTTGMAETGALLDGRSRPMAPGFAWHHTLGSADRLEAELGRSSFSRTTGLNSGIAPSIIKLDWLREQGHRFTADQRWLNVPEYVAYRLCGVQSAEISGSSRTGLFDIHAKTWWDDALAFLGASRSLLPGEALPGGMPLGPVRPDAPTSLRGAMVAVGGHDHPTAAIGVAGSEPGTLCLSLGTAEAQVRIVPAGMDPGTVEKIVGLGGNVSWHPLGDRLIVLAALPTGITLTRLARLIGCDQRKDRLALSESALREPETGSVPVTLRDIGYDSFGIGGITDGLTPAAVWRAAVRQLVASSERTLRDIESVLGPRSAAVVYGGWIHDPLVRQERQRQLGAGTRFTAVGEPGAVGAALLAARAAGAIDRLPGRLLTTSDDGTGGTT